MRRVLMTADTVGGVWTYALDLVCALPDTHFHLATMGGPLSSAQAENAALHSNLTVHESTYKLEWMPDPWDDVARAGDWLLELEQAVRPDVVHLNGCAHAALPFHAPKITVGHSCVLSWWRAVRGEDAPAEWDTYAQKVWAGLQASSVIVAPTQAMLLALKTHYGPFSAPTQVVPNGRDGSLYAPAAKEPFVLSAGRIWDAAKGTDTLAGAAPGLPWPVCVAGDNCAPNDSHAAAFPNVELLGLLPPPALAAWMARASIYALPARYEPFGLSALEAALSGCALVLGDIPSLRDVWGDAARFVPPGNADALRRALLTLMENDSLRRDMAERARRRASHYTLANMANGYRAAYRQAREGRVACAS